MAKTEADGLNRISIKFLLKHGYLSGGRWGVLSWTGPYQDEAPSVGVQTNTMSEPGFLRIVYARTNSGTDEKKEFDYKVPLTTTPCGFGGIRYWFTCPWYRDGNYCGKRVGVLYQAGPYFACRHCYDLCYHSQLENRRSRFSGLTRVFDLEEKVEALREQIKRPYYAGKPTRKMRKLFRLGEISVANWSHLERNKLLK